MDAALMVLANVMSVYSGRPGCMCGCRGNHRYARAHRDLAGRDRGYPVLDEDVSDRSVARIFNLFLAHRDDAEIDGNHAYFEVGSRCYCVYFVPPPPCGHMDDCALHPELAAACARASVAS